MQMVLKQVKMPYVPTLRDAGDTSHFFNYPESLTGAAEIREGMDPFLQWTH
jgi:hypothetical protein